MQKQEIPRIQIEEENPIPRESLSQTFAGHVGKVVTRGRRSLFLQHIGGWIANLFSWYRY
jgi:hypothetical protein